jgi:hypothetical protein
VNAFCRSGRREAGRRTICSTSRARPCRSGRRTLSALRRTPTSSRTSFARTVGRPGRRSCGPRATRWCASGWSDQGRRMPRRRSHRPRPPFREVRRRRRPHGPSGRRRRQCGSSPARTVTGPAVLVEQACTARGLRVGEGSLLHGLPRLGVAVGQQSDQRQNDGTSAAQHRSRVDGHHSRVNCEISGLPPLLSPNPRPECHGGRVRCLEQIIRVAARVGQHLGVDRLALVQIQPEPREVLEP